MLSSVQNNLTFHCLLLFQSGPLAFFVIISILMLSYSRHVVRWSVTITRELLERHKGVY